MKSVLRLIHVSDLHFGDDINSPSWKHAPSGGLAVHDLNAATCLSDSLRYQRSSEPTPMRVIASGDLTTWGRHKAFSTAVTFLRSQTYVGTRKSVGLDDPDTPVVPGNHDIWAVFARALVARTGLGISVRNNFDSYFDPPAPNLYSGNYFPYCVRLMNGPPTVYCYGIDSNQLEHTSLAYVKSFMANGYVTTAQLDELEQLVQNEDSTEPRIRIAVLHHPLAYKTRQHVPIASIKALINDVEVLGRLQRLGFVAALVGHEHVGFYLPNGAPNNPGLPIYTLSVGTATQIVRLSSGERQILSYAYKDVKNKLRSRWIELAEKCNEFRLYELLNDPNADLGKPPVPRNALKLAIRSFRYYQNLKHFAEEKSAKSHELEIGHYVIN